MDYIIRDTSGLEWLNPLVFLIFGITAILLIRMTLLHRRKIKGKLSAKQIGAYERLAVKSCLFGAASAVGFWAFLCVPLFQMTGARAEQNERLQAEAEEYYGLTLDSTDHYWLRYPEERPEVDFKAYGSVGNTSLSDEGEIISRSITLVWTEGKMIFASEDERGILKPLEPKK